MTTSVPAEGIPGAPLLLRGGGTLVILAPAPDADGGGSAGQLEIAYWGADFTTGAESAAGEVPAASSGVGAGVWAARGAVPPAGMDVPLARGLVPEEAAGYRLTPGLAGHRAGVALAPRLCTVSVREIRGAAGTPADITARGVDITARDDEAELAVLSELRLDAFGVLRVRHTVTNMARDAAFDLAGLVVTLPLPARATDVCDFTGKWSAERAAQRVTVPFGAWVRESRLGRPGASSSYLTLAGTQGFSHRRGEVWAAHVAWSGNQQVRIEADPDGTRTIVAGELLEPGEIRLGPGESYATPWIWAAFSRSGIDGVTNALHRSIRARVTHPRSPRPVSLNTWEAVYFDHDLATLTRLAETAAEIGVERFVLDDGWFGSRRDDTRGLGDWTESKAVWPQGLSPLVDRVRELGMQFGLWVEPEMVNPDSDLYRAHPDWVLADPRRLPPLARGQLVLDLARPGVSEHLFERLDRLVKTYAIAYFKWDHNRDVIAAVHASRAGVHAQTLAVYALMDRLRAANPGLEIESCASGGSRVDLGILGRTDRVWASDCNDALERQSIQAGTRTLLPLELIGAHVGPPRSHTTGRTQDLSFRVATAMFGHFGIEWDIASADEADLAGLAAAIAEYRRLRPLLHTGDLVTVDHPDPAAMLYGVVAADRQHALFSYVQCAMGRFETPPAARLLGLDPVLRYAVRVLAPAGMPRMRQRTAPPWLAAQTDAAPGTVAGAGPGTVDAAPPLVVGGGALGALGLAMPALEPEQALLIELTAI